jgi:hypothetical protein
MVESKDALNPDSERIRGDIAQTRAGIDRTLDALEARLQPRELAKDALALVKRRSSSGAIRAWHAVREHPLPMSVIAAGIGWLAYEKARRRPSAGETAAGTVAEVNRRASSAASAVGETAARVKESASRTAASAPEQAAGLTESVKDQASYLGARARERGRQVRRGVIRAYDEQPLAAGLGLLVAGIVFGLLLPPTDREDGLMGPSRDRLLDSARRAARAAAKKAERVGEVAADAAKDAAEHTRRAAAFEVSPSER